MAIFTSMSFREAIAQYDRTSDADKVKEADLQRSQVLKRFPIARWPEMTLEEYALGQEDTEDTFCRWVEFKTPHLGSIRGGHARKHIIYKHKERPGWHFPKDLFDDERMAWEQLRTDFVQAFEYANNGNWLEIEGLDVLAQGPALRLKTLHIYFPEDVLPVYSFEHLRHFYRLVTGEDGTTNRSEGVQANQRLLAALREVADLDGWSTKELERFLYWWSDPREARRVVKIAPGRGAVYWPDCLRGGYICAGWEKIGDLTQFESKSDFKKFFAGVHEKDYNGHPPAISRKGNELWTLSELEPGDLVVANQGMSKILAVGQVVEPGYVWRDDRDVFKHTVTVDWDTSFESTIPQQKSWAMSTVKKVPEALFEEIASRARGGGSIVKKMSPVDPLYQRISGALKRKLNLVLYGPPGTGKTYTARRFAVWWLLRESGDPRADTVLGDSKLMADCEQELSSERNSDTDDFDEEGGREPGWLTRVTFHPSYTYEDFVEGFRPSEQGARGLALHLEDGVFKRVCRAAKAHPDRPYLIMVDEFNRGNVAKILGELITLLEQDKRGLTVSLPQSKQMFSIPPNVYFLGTMNTADRSIKLLDVALRRRFAFIELMPDLELLRGATVGELALDEFLEGLNGRIAESEGREKQIGHAYLLNGGEPVSEIEDFADLFREEILPLLQEYCYDEYGTLAKFIGSELVDEQANALNYEKIDDAEQLVRELVKTFGSKSGGDE